MRHKTEKRVTLSQPPFSEGPCANLLFPPTPGWRNWQTQRTQNPPVLSTLGVQLPLPAPSSNLFLQCHSLVAQQASPLLPVRHFHTPPWFFDHVHPMWHDSGELFR